MPFGNVTGTTVKGERPKEQALSSGRTNGETRTKRTQDLQNFHLSFTFLKTVRFSKCSVRDLQPTQIIAQKIDEIGHSIANAAALSVFAFAAQVERCISCLLIPNTQQPKAQHCHCRHRSYLLLFLVVGSNVVSIFCLWLQHASF